jgi:hypothetical protein
VAGRKPLAALEERIDEFEAAKAKRKTSRASKTAEHDPEEESKKRPKRGE